MMEALVLHHAPTNKEPGQIIGCRVDRPLSHFGKETSHRLAEWLKEKRDAGEYAGIHRIVTSPLRRAVETASHVADACGLEILPDPRLRAQDFGELDGLTFDQIETDSSLRKFLWSEIPPEDRETTQPPGGESNCEFRHRTLTAVDELTDNGTLFIVHGTVIDALIARCLGQEMNTIEGINRAYEGDLLEITERSFVVREHTFAPYGHISGIKDANSSQRRNLIYNYIQGCEREDERIHLQKLLDHLLRYRDGEFSE